jgi:osmoprotectant transport system ATP-binding protein
VTHDIAEAGKLASDIVLMDRGRIIQEGSLRELLLRPAGERVRQFLGGQAQGLALDALRLNELLADLPRASSSSCISLRSDRRLGEVLVALADAGEGDAVVIDGDPERAYSARALRERLLADLRAAAPGGGP